MSEHTSRILQLCISAGFLVFTLIDWSYNRIGQNIINLTATSLFTLGLDRIVIVYQWYQGSSAFEYQATFVVFCLLVLGRLFEKYNPSETAYTHFNLVCGVTLLFYLLLNTLFLLACTVILMLYTCRQIYRLMTDALLSSTQSIQRNELDLVLSLQKPYA